MSSSAIPIAPAGTPGERPPRRTALAPAIVALGIIAIIVPPIIATLRIGPTAYEQIYLTFPGFDVAVPTAFGQGLGDLAAMLTLGALLYLLFFRDARGKQAKRIEPCLELTVLRIASVSWAMVSAAMVVFEALDSSGMPFARLSEPGAFAFLYETSAFPRAWTVSLLAAVITSLVCQFVTRWTGLLIPLWATCFGILAPVVVGQILVGPNHDLGSDAGTYQTLATGAVFGVIIIAAIRAAQGRRFDPVIVTRLTRFVLVGIPLIVATDVLLTWFKLAGSGLLDSETGWQILARWTCLALLIVALLGWRAAQRANPAQPALLPPAIATLAITGWIGITAAMTRIPPPHYFQPTTISQVFLGFNVDEPPSLLVWFTHWRPNVLFIVLAIAAVAAYLWAVRVLRRRGDTWPLGRTISWIGGWCVIVFATSSGFGKYSAPDFGTHMIVHMSLNMLAPILLVMGGIITLLLRATRADPTRPAGLHHWITWVLHWKVLRFVFNPLFVFALFVGSYYGLYFTGIFEEGMRFHWAHQLMNIHFIIAGYLFYGLVIGVDRPPRPLPHIGKLGFVLAAMPFHAFFGVILMMADGEWIAENFYLYFGLPWTDLQASQYLGGGVAWAGGELPLLLVIIALGIQWSRQDAKEARRKDRHMDSGRDEEFDDYNKMLETLSNRRQATGPRRPAPQSDEEPQP
ncbi:MULTISPECIES: cytochrome c oxidase assembly protein [Leucobacter]|uniref:Putative copper resistance protein D n=1 Tax=Leucobacter chromiiresistens TaxID=1079994 RepID=A0A1H0YI08_9MICO|nr:cytochrome c oxidase assembly protein [Leucobacter chromiiresistens]SDQ14680.1 putative copper resistance protein D [Leucobacter chromiiresistens]